MTRGRQSTVRDDGHERGPHIYWAHIAGCAQRCETCATDPGDLCRSAGHNVSRSAPCSACPRRALTRPSAALPDASSVIPTAQKYFSRVGAEPQTPSQVRGSVREKTDGRKPERPHLHVLPLNETRDSRRSLQFPRLYILFYTRIWGSPGVGRAFP